MSQSVYKKVDYTLQGLIDKIKLGELALPDLQRPFIWKNANVRDLFDSLYLGYPVGFFLFWETAGMTSSKSIGTSEKQKEPKLLVVDGQQRLTSLYAVVNGAEVFRDNFKKEKIEIAFDPIAEKFEVANITTSKNRNFVSNISRLWGSDVDLYDDVAEPFVKNLREVREVPDEEARLIRKRIQRVQNLINTPFIALELSSEIDVEAVSDVFVRINSKGKSLQQADFILTLMSVFWEQGRRDLEEFSSQTKTPNSKSPSAFNYFADPDPDLLLRAGIGLGFRRARLKYVYLLLTGRDLESKQKDEARRDEQFEVLKAAQAHALNLQNWHDYLKCIRDAGFRSSKMISGKMNIIYTYIIYLIGGVDFNIDKRTLSQVISQWFFMSALTGRYSSSPESQLEGDLARLRDATSGEEFIATLKSLCAEKLTDDFWNINLPAALANSSATNSAMMAYFSSLCILKAPALYSKRLVSDLLDPSLHSPRSAIERHHIFPKDYLKGTGYTQTERNQTANFAILEYTTNSEISNKPPMTYVPEYEGLFNNTQLTDMDHWHALPDGWKDLDYNDFLSKRRVLMSGIIREGYKAIVLQVGTTSVTSSISIVETSDGEGDSKEFKSTLRKNLHTGSKDPKMELAVMKTIAGFLNSEGGTLYVGVADDGSAIGLDEDEFANEDKILLHVTNLINSKLGQAYNLYINFYIEDYEDKRILVVNCLPSKSAVWLKDGGDHYFFVRTGASTSDLRGPAAQSYIEQRYG